MKKFGAVFGAVSLLALPLVSNAAAFVIDTSDATAQITEGNTAAGTIGMAFLAFCILVGVLLKLRRSGS